MCRCKTTTPRGSISKHSTLVLLSTVLLISLGCRNQVTEDEEPVDLVGPLWALEAFEQANGIQTTIGSQAFYIAFFGDGSVEGFSETIEDPDWEGNDYFTTYVTAPPNLIEIVPARTTEILRPLPHQSRWFEFQRALAFAESYEIIDNELRITYDRGQHLIFTPRSNVLAKR